MPQWRKLYVKTTESLDINDMPDDFTRLMWVLLPLGLDREGRGLDNLSWIKAKIFPLRIDVTLEMIKTSFNWFERRGMVQRYEVEGRKYFMIPTWHNYQGSTDKEAPSSIPEPVEFQSNSRPTPDLLQSKSVLDVDSDVDVDSDKDINAANAAPVDRYPLTAGQREFLTAFGAKRFKTTIQKDSVLEAEKKYGTKVLEEYVIWAAKKGLSLGDAVGAIDRTLPNWGKPKAGKNGSGPPEEFNAARRKQGEAAAEIERQRAALKAKGVQ